MPDPRQLPGRVRKRPDSLHVFHHGRGRHNPSEYRHLHVLSSDRLHYIMSKRIFLKRVRGDVQWVPVGAPELSALCGGHVECVHEEWAFYMLLVSQCWISSCPHGNKRESRAGIYPHRPGRSSIPRIWAGTYCQTLLRRLANAMTVPWQITSCFTPAHPSSKRYSCLAVHLAKSFLNA